MELKLERRTQQDESEIAPGVLLTPPLNQDYWSYRVRLSDEQAVVGFPKFGVTGIGFAVEDDDWNTNLPASCPVEKIAAHIASNKGDDSIDDATVLQAIRMIQQAVMADGK